ncbi:MAG: cell envelope integrity protein CreD [Acidobacteria bacterium]|nr:cell envelope integrity protein CreD [Acidobacteriota bacterium]
MSTTPGVPSLLHSPVVKVFVTGMVAMVLLIPLVLVGGLVSERVGRRDEVTREVSAMWGGRQTTGAIVLTVPFDEVRQVANGVETVTREAHFLPSALTIAADVTPEVRARSIFRVVVYRARLEFTGRFARPDVARIGATPSVVHWDRARVSVGVTDMRGVSAVSALTFGEARVVLEPGAEPGPLMPGGLRAATPLAATAAPATGDAADQGIPFALSMTLAGTEALAFVPAGAATEVTLRTPWPDPAFTGAFLPESRDVSAAGATARWQVAHFARGYPQAWVGGAIDRDAHRRQVAESEFSVGLVQAVDQYRQAERAVKYGVLFILLTFVVFFLWEVLASLRLHPVQYVLVGSALVVFYLLLLSISEHLSFALAYVVAASATTLLVTGYASSILRAGLRGAAVVGGWLATLYGVLFVLLQLEDLALLVGAVVVFAALAAVMWLTRRIDWDAARA